MNRKERRALAESWRHPCRLSVLQFCEREIDCAVRKAKREARSEATTCVDCRVVLLAEVPLCHSCSEIRDVYGIDRDSRKRFSREDADRMDAEDEALTEVR